jgi:Tfp pilus assembly protein PilZ
MGDYACVVTEPFARIPYVRRCVLRRDGRVVEAVLCNLSTVGVYVTFLRPLPSTIPGLGETVDISFLLPGDAQPLTGQATVTWQNLEDPTGPDSLPPGCGLRFASLAPHDHARIEDLIADYRSAAQPRAGIPTPHSGFVRVPYIQPCLLVSETATWEGVLCNLSLLGAYVTVDPIPPEGEDVKLFFRLPRESRPVEVASEVVWVNFEEPPRADSLPLGCGVRFVALDDDVRGGIERIVQDYESLPRGLD